MKRIFTAQQKMRYLQGYDQSGEKKDWLAKHGLHASMIYRWKRQAAAGGEVTDLIPVNTPNGSAHNPGKMTVLSYVNLKKMLAEERLRTIEEIASELESMA